MRTKVAVTAAGGGIAQSIIKSLKNTRYKTVGIDPKSDAAGLYMADYGRIGSNVNDPQYSNTLLRICKEEKCGFVFPGLDLELAPLSRDSHKFREAGIIPIVSPQNVIELSNNKWKLYQFLSDNGFPHIKSANNYSDFKNKGLEFPLILKPLLDGCRSRDVHVVNNDADLISILNISPPNYYIIQEYIDGDEYTCGSVTFNKKVFGTIQMKRTLRDGDTYKAYVKKNKTIDEFLNSLLTKINPFGPCNVQLRVRNNIPYVLEINARCSGTTAARSLAGFNEPKIICDHLSGKRVKYKIKEIAILRYWNECIVEYNAMEKIENESYVHGSKR